MKKMSLIFVVCLMMVTAQAEYFVRIDLPVDCYNYLVTDSGKIFSQEKRDLYVQESDSWKCIFKVDDHLDDHVETKSQVIGDSVILRCRFGDTAYPSKHKSKLFITNDYGESWIEGYSTLEDWYFSKVVYNSGALCALVNENSKTIFIASSDMGHTWNKISALDSKVDFTDPFVFDNRIYFACTGGYYYSVNNGESWIFTPIQMAHFSVNAFYDSTSAPLFK